ncbi:hypothetical protein Tco_0544070 [Tanacetum coccineum]
MHHLWRSLRIRKTKDKTARINGLCFRCNKKFKLGNRYKPSTFLLLEISNDNEQLVDREVEANENEYEEGINQQDMAEISFHAILGKTSRTTMKVEGTLEGRKGLKVSTVPSFGVQIKNGQIIQCNQICRVLSLVLPGLKITEDYFHFSIGGADLKYKLQGVPSVAKTDVSLQNYLKLPDATSDSPRTRVEILGIQSILSVYQDVFADVNTLPLNRSHTHSITLLPNSTPPNIRPYRYPYDQKTEIEAHVNELLTCGFVRPSSSPFANPVLLIALDLLRTNKFFANAKECAFGHRQIHFLGHVVSKDGVAVDPKKVQAVLNWPLPRDSKEDVVEAAIEEKHGQMHPPDDFDLWEDATGGKKMLGANLNPTLVK